ncbi:hypothetical protein H500_05530 [Helicobacter pylori CG-IMSS-2012]|nr:hypothetical protein H500_05530 [Helicobacter pylori CG-IMSS-2012]
MRNYRSLFASFFILVVKTPKRYFLDFITNIQNRANFLKPYKDQ